MFFDVTGKWGGLILRALGEEKTTRFGELKQQVEGISERILAKNLKNLERHGLVTRTYHYQIPPRVEYSLTSLGNAFAVKMRMLCELIEQELPFIEDQQWKFDNQEERTPWQQPKPSSFY
ncbi:MAG: helix-turn-helix transcriptional regulator [Bacteroidia bacterium]|nr:helix-turn-helix transcriptional regulator [Bacteroidia bacterium]